MKRNKIIYWSTTILLSLMMIGSSYNFIFNYKSTIELFNSLGVSTALIYPLAIAKLLGAFAIITNWSSILKRLAYAGFALDFIAAVIAHLSAGDGMFFAPVLPLILLGISFYFERKSFSTINN